MPAVGELFSAESSTTQLLSAAWKACSEAWVLEANWATINSPISSVTSSACLCVILPACSIAMKAL
jgi:hypothetical protein